MNTKDIVTRQSAPLSLGEGQGVRLFIAFVIKETKHILRDKRTMLILFGMPVVMMLLFGFAITTDVKNVRTVVVTSEMSPRTQQAVERLAQSEYFVITQMVNTPREAEQLIRSQKADMALVFTQNHGMQMMVDGSDPNMAQQWTTYAQQTLFNEELRMKNEEFASAQSSSADSSLSTPVGLRATLSKERNTSLFTIRSSVP